MKMFWRQLLSRQLTPQTFSQLYFSVLGLGDSSYAKFNYVAKRLFRRLEGLGKLFVICSMWTGGKLLVFTALPDVLRPYEIIV